MNICNMQKVAMRLAVGLVGIVLVAQFTSSVDAQQFALQVQANGDQKEMMQQQFHDSLEQHKLAAENRIASRISDLNRACELSEQQVKKLEVASKGAIKANMKVATEKLVAFSKQIGFEFDPNAEPKEEDEEEADEDNLPVRQMAFAMPFMGNNGAGNPDEVEENKVWKSAIKKVLTPEQSEKWTAWVKDRKAFQRQVAVHEFIAKADRKLLLSPEQRESLAEHVDSEYGKKLAEAAAQRDANQFGANVFIGGMINQAMGRGDNGTEETEDPVKAILSESQFRQWNQSFAPTLEQLQGAVNGMGMIRLAAPVPAVLAGEVEAVEPENDEDSDDDDN